jgi:hypothetical protein
MMIVNVNTIAKRVLRQTDFANGPALAHAPRTAFGCVVMPAAARTYMYRN